MGFANLYVPVARAVKDQPQPKPDDAPELVEAAEMLLRLVDDMMPGVRYIALQDYKLLNEAPIKARQAIAALRQKVSSAS